MATLSGRRGRCHQPFLLVSEEEDEQGDEEETGNPFSNSRFQNSKGVSNLKNFWIG
jgi:hypothetical protein